MSPYLDHLFNLKGKNAVVTGGNDGIGKMIASALIQAGANVWIIGRKPAKNTATASELTAMGPGTCQSLDADLANMAAITDTVAALQSALPNGCDVLINNAGTTWGAPTHDFPEKGWDRVMNLNLKGLFYFTEAILPLLKQAATDSDWSRVINISSVGSRFYDKETASVAYSVSKAAVENLTRTLARDHSVDQVSVNAIAPGWFPTNMTGSVEWAAENWRVKTPMQRLGNGDDIGGLVICLCSRAGSYITGQIIDLDGGRTLHL